MGPVLCIVDVPVHVYNAVESSSHLWFRLEVQISCYRLSFPKYCKKIDPHFGIIHLYTVMDSLRKEEGKLNQ